MRLLKQCQWTGRLSLILFCSFLMATEGGELFARNKAHRIAHHKQYKRSTPARSLPEPKNIQEKLDQILLTNGLSRSPASIEVISLTDGRVVLEKNSNVALNPASNMKLVTEAAALRELGSDFTFKTEFYADAPVDRNGTIRHLWIRGMGDPFFVSEDITSVVNMLREAGIRKISGDIYVDDSYFDHNDLISYVSDSGKKSYTITTGPLSFNFNNLLAMSRLQTRLGDESTVSSRRLSKRISRAMLPRSPSLYTGTVIMRGLQEGGILLDKGLLRGNVPARATLIGTYHSLPLREILKGLGKHSNNFMAEQVLKTIGAVREGIPGSTEKGIRVLNQYMVSLGIPENEFMLDNGSGLSMRTRLSADHLVKLLMDIYHSSERDELISTLSIAGVDGTMKRKMKNSALTGKVFVKTGTLNGVRALSGYLLDGGKKYAFSFIFNDFSVPVRKIVRAEEDILRAVQEHRS